MSAEPATPPRSPAARVCIRPPGQVDLARKVRRGAAREESGAGGHAPPDARARRRVGLDLVKTVVQRRGAEGGGRAALRRTLRRADGLQLSCQLGDAVAYVTARCSDCRTLVARNVRAATQTMEGPAGVSRT